MTAVVKLGCVIVSVACVQPQHSSTKVYFCGGVLSLHAGHCFCCFSFISEKTKWNLKTMMIT